MQWMHRRSLMFIEVACPINPTTRRSLPVLSPSSPRRLQVRGQQRVRRHAAKKLRTEVRAKQDTRTVPAAERAHRQDTAQEGYDEDREVPRPHRDSHERRRRISVLQALRWRFHSNPEAGAQM